MSEKILNLIDFYGEMADKGLRLQHQYQVVFSPNPGARNSISSEGGQDLIDVLTNVSFYASTANLPGRVQNVISRKYLGYEFQIPGTTDYTKSIQMEMLCDSGRKDDTEAAPEQGARLRNALFLWTNYHSKISLRNGIADSNGGGVKRIPSGSEIRLNLLDEKLENVVEVYKLHGAFPAEIGDMQLSQDSGDPATFGLNIAYQYFTVEEAD